MCMSSFATTTLFTSTTPSAPAPFPGPPTPFPGLFLSLTSPINVGLYFKCSCISLLKKSDLAFQCGERFLILYFGLVVSVVERVIVITMEAAVIYSSPYLCWELKALIASRMFCFMKWSMHTCASIMAIGIVGKRKPLCKLIVLFYDLLVLSFNFHFN